MYLKLDWLSISLPVPTDRGGRPRLVDAGNRFIVQRQAFTWYHELLGGECMSVLFNEGMPEMRIGAYGYRHQCVDPTSKARLHFDGNHTHFLLEIPGTGCDCLDRATLLLQIVAKAIPMINRLDLAVDIACDLDPDSFTDARIEGRFSTASVWHSKRGHGSYVGSMGSIRYAYVYRYQPPHPRSPYLRIEHRFKKERAAQMAAYLIEHGLIAAIKTCGEIFGWQHPLWEASQDEFAKLPKLGVDAKQGMAIHWLLTQVFPALRRYEEEGVIDDLWSFLQLHLFNDEESTDG
jgi:DNA relaxase NicK